MVKYIYCLYENKYDYGSIETCFIGYFKMFEEVLEKVLEFNENNIPKKGYIENIGYFYDKFEIQKNTKYFASICNFHNSIIFDIKSIQDIKKEELNETIRTLGLKYLPKYNNCIVTLLDFNNFKNIFEIYYNTENITIINEQELLNICPQYKDYIELKNVVFYLENGIVISDTITDKLLVSLDERYMILKNLAKMDVDISMKNEKKNKTIMIESLCKDLDKYLLNINNYTNEIKEKYNLIENWANCKQIVNQLKTSSDFLEEFKKNYIKK